MVPIALRVGSSAVSLESPIRFLADQLLFSISRYLVCSFSIYRRRLGKIKSCLGGRDQGADRRDHYCGAGSEDRKARCSSVGAGSGEAH